MHFSREGVLENASSGFRTGLMLLILVGAVLTDRGPDTDSARPPNVVIFIMDDVGMGDIGCYGNDTIKTPNIDGLAREGGMLTQHIALPMCTPSRAALMTGRLPVRYGMDLNGGMRVLFFLSAGGGLPSREITIAELLKDAGYSTALIGKWHLGITCDEDNSCSDPNSQGFDYFYGLPLTNLLDCGKESTIFHAWAKAVDFHTKMGYSVIAALVVIFLLKWLNGITWKGVAFLLFLVLLVSVIILLLPELVRLGCVLMENREVVEYPLRYDHLTERLHSRAVQFMERHQDQPFFLVMSFVQAHTALFNNDQFRNHSLHGRYGDNLEEMDWSVGEVLASLKKLDLEGDTFVYLTSDNGGHVEEFTENGERQGGWNGIYKGGKASTWEGGIRVPTVVKYPGIIPPGTVVSQPTHLPDVLPTVARVTGVKLPDDRVYDGRDLIPLLTSTGKEEILHEFMFHYCGGSINAVRYTPRSGGNTYKVHYVTSRLVPGIHGIEGCFDVFLCGCSGRHVHRHDPPIVYDLTADPSETRPLDTDNPRVAQVIERVAKAVSDHQMTVPRIEGTLPPWVNMLPRPWARSWCGTFPHYTCTDPLLDHFNKIKKDE